MSNITAKISEHPTLKDAFILDVERYGKLVVARDFHLGSRNDNFSRAVTQAEEELRRLLPDAKSPDHIRGVTEMVRIEPLGAVEWDNFRCIVKLYEKVNELIDRENLMEANVKHEAEAERR